MVSNEWYIDFDLLCDDDGISLWFLYTTKLCGYVFDLYVHDIYVF